MPVPTQSTDTDVETATPAFPVHVRAYANWPPS